MMRSARPGGFAVLGVGMVAVAGLLLSPFGVAGQISVPAESEGAGTNAQARAAGAAEVQGADIVVTATRVDRPRTDVPASVTTLSQAEIRSSPAQNPDDLLRTVGGVSVLRSYGMGYGIPSQINIRGVPGIHGVLLLADGTPLNEATTGFQSINEVPESALREIEVVRGPFSALYGADAFAGVVQLFTLDPAGPPLLEAAGRAGNEGFRQVWANARGAAGPVGLVLSVDGRSIDNYAARDTIIESRLNPQTGQSVDIPKPADNYDYRDFRLLAKAGAAVGDSSRLVVLGRVFDCDLGYGRTDYSPLPFTADNDTANRSALLGATLTSEVSDRISTKLGASYRRQRRELWGLDFAHMAGAFPVFVRSYSRATANEWRAEGLASVRLNARNTLTPGVDLARVDAKFSPTKNDLTGEPLPLSSGRDADSTHTGFYLQDEAALTDRLRFTGGARLDSDTGYGEAFSPRGGLVYQATDDTTLRVSAGRAYRAPSLLERYQPDVAFGNQVFKANPDLKPEYIVSADGGVEQRFGDAWVAKLGAFYNEMDDLISTRVAGPLLTFENVDQAWSAGVEASVDYTFAEGTTAFVNYTRQESEDKNTKLDLGYVANDMLAFGLRFQQRVKRVGLEGSVTEQFVGERGYVDTATGTWKDLDAYWRTDAAVKSVFSERFWIGLGAQNLTDEKYEESATTLNPAPGRLWYVEAGVRM